MISVSIVSLIYQSMRLADWVHDSVHKFTPMIARGEAEFFFVANDATAEVVHHLRERNYPYIVNVNRKYSDTELFALGYAMPEYIGRVYRGYNEGIRHARGEYVALVNSDNYFSPDWLENLLKYSDPSRVIACKLVERYHPTFSVFPGARHGEFGATVDDFDEKGFLEFVSQNKKLGLEIGGAYMPALYHREVALEAGLFPAGNVAGGSFEEVAKFGDQAFFEDLAALGVSHYTSLDSISYHLKEGERADSPTEAESRSNDGALGQPLEAAGTPAVPYPMGRPARLVGVAQTSRGEGGKDVSALVIRRSELPALTTLREVVRSKALTQEQLERAKAELAALELTLRAEALENQSRRFRAMVERLVGKRFSAPVMTVVHMVSWTVRPVRRALARSGRRTRA